MSLSFRGVVAYLKTLYNSSGSASRLPKSDNILFKSRFPLIPNNKIYDNCFLINESAV
jgi:hypothetical protein